jgi:hypothetical protein
MVVVVERLWKVFDLSFHLLLWSAVVAVLLMGDVDPCRRCSV